MADFDGLSSPAPSLPEVQPESIAPGPALAGGAEPAPELMSPLAEPAQDPAGEPAPESTMSDPAGHENGKTPSRRSTVREKVTFLAETGTAAATVSAPEATPAPEGSPETTAEPGGDSPRRAGWWSRRFGGQ